MTTVWMGLLSIAALAARAGEREALEEQGDGEEAVELSALPAVIRTAVHAAAPGAVIEAATREGTEFEAKVTVDGHALELKFDATGQLLETEEEIAVADLPAPVRQALAADYAKWTAERAEMATPAGAASVWEVLLARGERRLEVVCSADGRVVRSARAEHED